MLNTWYKATDEHSTFVVLEVLLVVDYVQQSIWFPFVSENRSRYASGDVMHLSRDLVVLTNNGAELITLS